MAAREEGGRKGCLVWGCVTVVAMALLVAGAIGLGVVKARRLRDALTATQPATVPVAETPGQKARKLAREYAATREAIRNGTVTTLTLTAEDLNQMVATVPELKDFRGRAYFDIDGDQLRATASIPLDQIPGFQGRYLNGDFDLDVSCRDGALKIYATRVTVKGKPLPPRIMEQLRTRNLAQQLYENPDAVEKLKNIESIRVADNKVTIVTAKRQ